MKKHSGMRPQDILIIRAVLADGKKINAGKLQSCQKRLGLSRNCLVS